MKRIRSFILFGFALALSGCSNNGGPSNGSAVIRPLAVSNKWIYQHTLTDSNGNIRTDTVTDSIRFTSSYQNSVWYVQGGSDIPDSLDPKFMYRNAADGLHFTINGASDNLIVKYPANTGDVFLQTLFVTSEKSPTPFDTTIAVDVEATDESLTVPAGTFSCYRYFYTYSKETAYYSPGIGLIENIASGGKEKWVLLHYELH